MSATTATRTGQGAWMAVRILALVLVAFYVVTGAYAIGEWLDLPDLARWLVVIVAPAAVAIWVGYLVHRVNDGATATAAGDEAGLDDPYTHVLVEHDDGYGLALREFGNGVELLEFDDHHEVFSRVWIGSEQLGEVADALDGWVPGTDNGEVGGS